MIHTHPRRRTGGVRLLLPPLFLLVLLLTGCPDGLPGLKNPDDSQTVDEALRQVKEDEINRIRQNKLEDHLLEEAGKWLSDSRFLFWYLALVIGLGIVTTLIYLIVVVILKRIVERTPKDRSPSALGPGAGRFLPDRLAALLTAGDYSGAVLYLHRGTLYILRDRREISTLNLTNWNIERSIRDPARREAFRRIARLAERILFDRFSAAEKDFKAIRGLFAAHFHPLGGDR